MSPIKQYTNTRVLISKVPLNTKFSKEHFRTEAFTLDAPVLNENELFLKTLTISLDPYIRHEFPGDATESPVIGYLISEVLDSKDPRFPVGSIVHGPTEWAEYNVVRDPELLYDYNRYDQPFKASGLPLSTFTGILGVPGFTVWDSLRKIGGLKAGETIYVSSAAGTLGQIAGQLAKRKGLRVIGSAGSQEKIDYLINELGFDAAFNYKTDNKKEALLAAAGPNGLDVYYDLVGDDTTDVVLEVLNKHGRIISIGVLHWHNNQAPAPLRNAEHILWKELRYEGYLVFDRYSHFPTFWEEVVPLVKNKTLKYRETVVDARGGNSGKVDLSVIGEAYAGVLAGKYSGKVTVTVANPAL
ncbi:hypothetical protein BGZ94_005233 [Podila epigama]|nr:hypothetical protein BGZ94_005233 [Podila epigama]